MGLVKAVMKAKIIRIRPFNMANFSSGALYVMLFVLYGFVILLPSIVLVVTGFAGPLKIKDKDLSYAVLKRRLMWFLLPICSIGFVILVYVYAGLFLYNLYQWYYIPALLFVPAVQCFGTFYCLLRAARVLDEQDLLYKSKWIVKTLKYMLVLLPLGVVGTAVLVGLGSMIGYFIG
jgi:hypothetical protein